MTVNDAVAAADQLLPGQEAQEGEVDPRWQAIIAVGEFVETEPEAVWTFISKWGRSADRDLRTAVATCLLEHLLQHHFDDYIVRVERLAREDPLFARTVAACWKFGQSEEPGRAARLDRPVASIRGRTG